jgi:hypothetical protein
VVAAEVCEHGDLGQHRRAALELEARYLADDDVGIGLRGGGHRRERGRDVGIAGEDGVEPRPREDRGRQGRRGRLPVGSGDADRRGASEPPAELELVKDLNPPAASLEQ